MDGYGNSTLYAHWTANTYAVTLDAQGGTGSFESVSATYDSEMPSIGEIPMKEHFVFSGYFDEETGGTKYYNSDGTSAKKWDKISETILYAHWHQHSWTIVAGTEDNNHHILYAVCSEPECEYYGTDDDVTKALSLCVNAPSRAASYDGNDFEATVTDKDGEWLEFFGSIPDISYEYMEHEGDSYGPADNKKDAGFYKASITADGKTACAEYQIAKADITPSVSIEDWKYDETASTPSVTGNAGNGTVTYRYKKTSEADTAYSATKPVDCGEYTVKAEITETKNYNAASATVSFEITKAESTCTAPSAKPDLKYTGHDQELVTVGLTNDGTMKYSLTEDGEYSTDIPVGKDAKKYTVYYKVVGDKNHSDTTPSSVTVTIGRGEWIVTAPVAKPGLKYNCVGQELITAGNVEDNGKLLYSTDGTVFDENIPQGENSGTFDIYYKVNADANHNEFTEETPIAVTIAKADWSVTAPTAITPSYTGSAQEIVNAGEVKDADGSSVTNKMLYSMTGNDDYSTTIPAASEVGSYTVYYKVDGDDNHNEYTVKTMTATIEKADRINLPTVVMAGYTFAATDELPTPSLSENAAENPDAVFWYNTENSFTGAKEWKNISSTTLDSGTYYMFASLSETDSYKACTTNGTAFYIDKAEYTGQTEFPVSLIYCKDFEPKEIAKADLMPADAGETSVEFKYSSVDNVSGYKDCDVNPDGDAILMYFEKIDSYVENTSCSFTFSVSTTNYLPYDVYVIVTRCPCTHPETEVVTMHRTLPGCETYGEDYRLCTVCNVIVEDNISVNPLGHSYDADGICEREGCGIISIAEGTGFEISAEDLIYNGESKTPVFAVTYKGTELVKGTDYTVEYDAQTDLGRYEAVITGIGGYRGSVTYLWAIIPPQEGLWCEDIEDQIYTGKTIKPEVDVYCDGILLTLGTDYTLKYGKNNVKAADKDAVNKKNVSIAPSVTISGKGNYKGKITKTFSIRERDLSDAEVDDILVASTGKDIKLVTTVKVDGRKLKAGTDFYFSTSEDGSDEVKKLKEAGEYELFVIGKGNYTGAVSFTCSIVTTVPASKVSIAKIGNQKYNGGEAVEPAVKITYKKKDVTDKFDIEFENNTEVGTANVIVTAKEAGVAAEGGAPANEVVFTGSRKATFKIVGTKISGAKLGEDGKGKIEECIYSGEECEPELGDIYLGKDKLTEDTDYAVEYANNINAGTATVIVTGKGGYVGTKKFSFKILPYDAANEDSEVIVEGEDNPAVVSYEKGGAQFNPVITMNGNALTPNKDYTVKYINNKTVAAYDDKNSKDKSIAPTVLITFKGNFTGKKTITYTIEAKEIGECNISIQDKVASTKAGSWKQKSFTITDVNGKKLAAKTDYDSKSVKYYSDEDCTQEIEDATLVPDTVVYVKVDGCKNYTGSIVGSYRISKINIKGAKVKVAAKEYTGAEITLDAEDLVVTIGSGKKKVTLDSTMYEIIPDSYRNNVKTGKASVVIKGIGDYCGTKTVKFSIKKKGFTWWKDLLKF